MTGVSAKMHRIRSAAVYAVMPVSASRTGAGGAVGAGGSVRLEQGFERFFSLYGTSAPNWVRTVLANKYRYACDYTDVQLAPPVDGTQYGDHEDLRVTVRHTFYLSIPYANRIFAVFGTAHRLPGGGDEYGSLIQASCTLTNQGIEDDIDVEQFPRQVGRGQS